MNTKSKYGFVITKDDGSIVNVPAVHCNYSEALDIARVMEDGAGIRSVIPIEMTHSPKQIIVMRKDLKMRRGKEIAQGSHASLGCVLQLMKRTKYDEHEERSLYLLDDTALTDWLNGSFTKICVGVDSEDELMVIYNRAKDAGLNTCLIEDNGLTEFHGIKTKTCVGIGPDYPDKIDRITKHLKLL
jgi:PTH2 family peptidyl-tRNA hydrolase